MAHLLRIQCDNSESGAIKSCFKIEKLMTSLGYFYHQILKSELSVWGKPLVKTFFNVKVDISMELPLLSEFTLHLIGSHLHMLKEK